MSGDVAVADKFLSFLPHRCKPLAGGAVDVDATVLNPGFLTPTGVTRNDPLQKIVNRRVLEDGVAKPKHPQVRSLRFALVDLTGPDKLANPQFAGHNETVQGGLGSLAKTACMYAAFQLKFDLEELARQKGLYDRLAVADIAHYLAEQNDAAFHLVIAADVFAYVADVAAVCAAVARVLAPGGLFAFTVETHDGDGAIVGAKMRYAHGETFIRDSIADAGLTLVDLTRASSRTENRVPVPGLLVVARR